MYNVVQLVLQLNCGPRSMCVVSTGVCRVVYICARTNGLNLLMLRFCELYLVIDRLCGLVVRVSGYRYRGLGFDSRRYQIF